MLSVPFSARQWVPLMKTQVGRVVRKQSDEGCVSGYDPTARRVGSAMAGVPSGLHRLCLALGGAQWFSGRAEGLTSRAK